MLQGHTKDGKSGLEVEQPWDVCRSAGLEAKVLREEVTYGPKII